MIIKSMQHYVVNTIKTQVSKLDLNFCYKELDKNIHHLKDNVGQFIGFRMTATYSKNKIYKLLVVSSLYVCNVAIENVYIYICVCQHPYIGFIQGKGDAKERVRRLNTLFWGVTKWSNCQGR